MVHCLIEGGSIIKIALIQKIMGHFGRQYGGKVYSATKGSQRAPLDLTKTFPLLFIT